jgi:hypothetical protein
MDTNSTGKGRYVRARVFIATAADDARFCHDDHDDTARDEMCPFLHTPNLHMGGGRGGYACGLFVMHDLRPRGLAQDYTTRPIRCRECVENEVADG